MGEICLSVLAFGRGFVVLATKILWEGSCWSDAGGMRFQGYQYRLTLKRGASRSFIRVQAVSGHGVGLDFREKGSKLED